MVIDWDAIRDLFKDVESYGAKIEIKDETLTITKDDNIMLYIAGYSEPIEVTFGGVTRKFTPEDFMEIVDVLKALVLSSIDGIRRGLETFSW